MINLTELSNAIRTAHMIEFQYTASNGEFTYRKGEPYEIRTEKTTDVFVWDIEKDEIRRFKTARMQDMVVLDETFAPRFDLKP
jgi:predicted DNA-binding transcriptional regulator YafY